MGSKSVVSKSLPKIYIKDKVYLPEIALIDVEEVKQKYTRRMYEEPKCRTCEYKEERHGPMCDACPAYKGTLKLYNTKGYDGLRYVGLPIGDKNYIERNTGVVYSDYEIVDKRKKVPFDYQIKFILKLREHQEKLLADFMKKKYGLIEAPPRTGKTALMVAIGVALGYKMLVLADQTEFLDQFIWHLEGNEDEGIPKCTNLPELERKHKKKLYGYPKTDEDFENFQFFVSTYQQYASEERGKDRFRQIARLVGTIAVDEVHSAAAPVFSGVVSRFYSRYRFGVTGTVERKDGKHYIIKKVFGPVVAKTHVEAMVPKVVVRETGFKARSIPKHFTYACQALARNKTRNELIVNTIIRDLKRGHYVVVPLMFKKHMLELCNSVNIAYGKEVAKVFMGGGTKRNKEARRQILSDAKSGKVKCTIGTRRLLQRGLNVPKWSVIYECMPINNKPNLKQETSRVRTPYEGKPQPIVRLFYDEIMGLSVGCARNTVKHMEEFGYEFSKDQKTQAATEWLRNSAPRGRGRSTDEVDDDMFKARRLINDDGESPMASFRKAGRK